MMKKLLIAAAALSAGVIASPANATVLVWGGAQEVQPGWYGFCAFNFCAVVYLGRTSRF